ncbi:MAG: type II toxin-antitoxin system RelE/ParE family toxin [Planctomycetes bacterium]|nr:type II toxin-antitoxin system RelE/ParE family toxin [Planctomycetota bacterium]
MTYQLRIERRVQNVLARVAQPHRNRLIKAIQGLATDPRPPGSRNLSGRDGWRVRVGDYRILYEIHDDQLLVLVIKLGHRHNVYRR